MESLAKTYNLKPWHEPRYGTLKKPNRSFDNMCIKVHLPSKNRYVKYTNEDWLELGSKFDHIIVLHRKLTTEYLESLYTLWDITKDMYVAYNYEVSLKNHMATFETKEDYEKHHESSTTQYSNIQKITKKRLNEIASLFNQKVVLYDELYYNPNKIDYLNGLEFNPDLNYKLRTDGITKIKTLI
jgi:hypothetical protein